MRWRGVALSRWRKAMPAAAVTSSNQGRPAVGFNSSVFGSAGGLSASQVAAPATAAIATPATHRADRFMAKLRPDVQGVAEILSQCSDADHAPNRSGDLHSVITRYDKATFANIHSQMPEKSADGTPLASRYLRFGCESRIELMDDYPSIFPCLPGHENRAVASPAPNLVPS